MKVEMPTRAEFEAAGKALIASGRAVRCSVLADDAKKDGVENFGTYYSHDDGSGGFWLNYKTIGRVPSVVGR